MRPGNVGWLAVVAIIASLSCPALSNADTRPATSTAQAQISCAVASGATANERRKACGGIMVLAQQERAKCIQFCRDAYNGGEPLKTCIAQCPSN